MHLTTGQLEKDIRLKHQVLIPQWRLRSTIDRLEAAGRLVVTRAGQYRMVSAADVPVIVTELQKLKLLPENATATA